MWGVPIHQEDMAVTLLAFLHHLKSLLLIPLAPATNTTNQEDMAATLLAFSYNVIVGIEMILGHPLSAEDQEVTPTQSTCFTSTKALILTPEELHGRRIRTCGDTSGGLSALTRYSLYLLY